MKGHLTEVFDAAKAVAEAPGPRRSNDAFAAKVPWSMIERLRTALEDSGVDLDLVNGKATT